MIKFNPETERLVVRGLEAPVVIPIPPEVLAIKLIEPTDSEIERGMPFETRVARARELTMLTGFPIDIQIDIWGWGAENTHKLRRLYGVKSVYDMEKSVQIMTAPY